MALFFSSPGVMPFAILTANTASTIPLTIRAHASQSGNLLVIENSGGTDQIVVDSTFGTILPTASRAGQNLAALRAANPGNNILWGHSTATTWCSIGATSGGGFPYIGFYCYHGATANTLARSSGSINPCRIVSTSTGALAFEGAAAGTVNTDITFTGWMHFQAGTGGQITIGNNTTNIARVGIVGSLDEIQLRVRGGSTQTGNISEVEANNGTTKYWAITGSTAGAGRMIGTALNSAIADGNLAASQFSFYLNEAGNTLTVKVKYADGTTVKTGTIALT